MIKKIKILFTIPNFDTAGSGRVVVDLVKGLDKTKFEPHICCAHDRGAYFRVVKDLGVPIHLFPFYSKYTPYLSLPWRIWKTSRFFKKHRFDIIHSWHWSSDFTEPMAAKWAGIPFVYTKKAMGWGNKAWHWRTRLSTRVIAINADMIKGFLRPYKNKVDYIPLGVDTNVFKPLGLTRSTPDGFHCDKDDFVVVSVANLAPVKGIEVLLEAIKKLNNQRIKVLIVGDHQSDYGKWLLKEYTEPYIFFIDRQLDVKPYLAVANLFVIPTKDEGRKEGLPIAPLEAMAFGKRVLGSRISGIRDILEDFPNCLFASGNKDELARLIKLHFEMSDEKAMAMEQEMRYRVISKFSLHKMISHHETFYSNLLR